VKIASRLFIISLILSGFIFAKTLVTVNGHKIDDSIIPKGYEKLNDEQMANLMEKLIKEELIHQISINSNIVRVKSLIRYIRSRELVAQKEYIG